VKLANISGTKKKVYLQAEMNEIATNNNKKNIGDLQKGINEDKRPA
jgi:hypothetical protein